MNSDDYKLENNQKAYLKRKKYTLEEKKQALEQLKTFSLKEVSKQLDIPIGTLKDWKNRRCITQKEPFAPVNIQEEKSEYFVRETWDLILNALKLAKSRIRLAYTKETKIEQILKDIFQNDSLSEEMKKELIKQMDKLQLPTFKDIINLINDLFEKQKLVKGNGEEMFAQLCEADKSLLKKVVLRTQSLQEEKE